jgi:hypothetical protein
MSSSVQAGGPSQSVSLNVRLSASLRFRILPSRDAMPDAAASTERSESRTASPLLAPQHSLLSISALDPLRSPAAGNVHCGVASGGCALTETAASKPATAKINRRTRMA